MWDERKCMVRRRTPRDVATRELMDAQLAKLAAQTAQEHAAALASFHDVRVRRLTKFLSELPGDAP